MDLCQIWASYLRNFHNLYFLHCLFCSILVLAWPPLPLYHQKHFASACPRIGIPAPTLSVFSNSQRLKVGTANIVRAVKSSKCSTPALDIWDTGPQGYCRPLNDFRTKWPKTRSKNKKLQTLLHFFSSNLVNDDLMFFSFFPFKLFWLKWYLPSDLCFQRFQQTILCTSPTKWTILLKIGFWLWWWRNRWWWW